MIPLPHKTFIPTMVVRVVKFLSGGTKLERFLPKNQHTQWKLLNFKGWVNGRVVENWASC